MSHLTTYTMYLGIRMIASANVVTLKDMGRVARYLTTNKHNANEPWA